MRPTRLRVQGLASFVEPIEVDFEGLDLFAITGPTGSGKTSLLTAMTAALYGRAPEVGDDLRQLISTGANEAKILLEFAAGGRHYRAQRAFHRTRAADVRLEIEEKGAWRALIRGAREGRGEVERILGLTYEAFTKVVLLPQGQVTEFLKGQGRDRRKIMTDLLGLDIYQRIQQAANQEANAAQARAEATQRLIATDYADATSERLAEVRAELARVDERIAATDRAIVLVDAAVAAARAEHQQAEALASARAEDEAAAGTVARLDAGFTASSTLVERLTGELSTIENHVTSIGYDGARHRALHHADGEARRLRVVRDDLDRLAREARDGRKREADLERQRAAGQKAAAEADRAQTAAEADLAKARTALAAIEGEVGPRVEVVRLRERARQYVADVVEVEQAVAAHRALEAEIARLADVVERAREREQSAAAVVAETERAGEAAHKALEAAHDLADRVARATKDADDARGRKAEMERAQATVASEVVALTAGVARAAALAEQAEAAEREAALAVEAARSAHMAHVLRQGLAAGAACPVCEQTIAVVPAGHAPHVETADAARAKAERARRQADEGHRAAREAAARGAVRGEAAERDLAAAAAAVEAAETALRAALPADLRRRRTWRPIIDQRAVEAEREAERALAALREHRGAAAEAADAHVHARAEHGARARTLADRARAVALLTERRDAGAAALDRAIGRADDGDLDAALADIEARLTEAERACAAATQAADAARGQRRDADEAFRQVAQALEREQADAKRRAADAERAAGESRELEAAIVAVLGAADERALDALPRQLEALADAERARDAAEQRRADVDRRLAEARVAVAQGRGNLDAARARAVECRARATAAEVTWTAARGALDETAAAAGVDAALDSLVVRRRSLDAEREANHRAHGSLAADERAVTERIERAARLDEELAEARQAAAVAKELGQLLGGQQLQNWLLADAMRLLAEDAAAHLERLSDQRYRLRVKELDFEVIDRWNADAVRSVKTLSGGETFLTALAVALALAERIAGRAEAALGQHPLESLFIDEGFGTLDADEALEHVAEALEQLRASHRMIGVITHLPQLANRLPTQIRVIKDMGRSRIETVAT